MERPGVMCEQCREREARDKAMWEAIRLGLISMSRGLGAIIKGIEKRYALNRDDQRAA